MVGQEHLFYRCEHEKNEQMAWLLWRKHCCKAFSLLSCDGASLALGISSAVFLVTLLLYVCFFFCIRVKYVCNTFLHFYIFTFVFPANTIVV